MKMKGFHVFFLILAFICVKSSKASDDYFDNEIEPVINTDAQTDKIDYDTTTPTDSIQDKSSSSSSPIDVTPPTDGVEDTDSEEKTTVSIDQPQKVVQQTEDEGDSTSGEINTETKPVDPLVDIVDGRSTTIGAKENSDHISTTEDYDVTTTEIHKGVDETQGKPIGTSSSTTDGDSSSEEETTKPIAELAPLNIIQPKEDEHRTSTKINMVVDEVKTTAMEKPETPAKENLNQRVFNKPRTNDDNTKSVDDDKIVNDDDDKSESEKTLAAKSDETRAAYKKKVILIASIAVSALVVIVVVLVVVVVIVRKKNRSQKRKIAKKTPPKSIYKPVSQREKY